MQYWLHDVDTFKFTTFRQMWKSVDAFFVCVCVAELDYTANLYFILKIKSRSSWAITSGVVTNMVLLIPLMLIVTVHACCRSVSLFLKRPSYCYHTLFKTEALVIWSHHRAQITYPIPIINCILSLLTVTTTYKRTTHKLAVRGCIYVDVYVFNYCISSC